MTVRKKLLPISLLVMLLVLPADTWAQSQNITLDQAIELALKNNREVKIAKMDVEKSSAAVSEAFGYALPSVDLSAGYTRFLQKPKVPFPDFNALLKNSTYSILFDENVIPRDESKFLPIENILQSFSLANNYQAQIQVSQILFNSGVFTGIGASKVFLDLSKENLKRTVSKTVLSVKKTYYGVLLAKDLSEIAESRFTNANEHLQNIQALRQQGLVSEFDEMQAKVQVENIRPILLQLENALKDAKNGLKILMMMDQSADINVEGNLIYNAEELPTDIELINEAETFNLDISTLKIKRQLDEEFVAIDRSDYWPTVAAFGNYSYAGSSDDWNFQNYQSSTVGLNFTINLFKGGRTSNKVQQDQIVAMQTDEQISTLKDLTVSRVKSKLNDLRRVKEQIQAMEKNVELAERAYKISENRYKEGEGSQLEVKDSDIALSQSKVNYTNAVHDYVVARAELFDLVGRVDPKYYKYINDVLNN